MLAFNEEPKGIQLASNASTGGRPAEAPSSPPRRARRGFAAMSPERQREIARKGGSRPIAREPHASSPRKKLGPQAGRAVSRRRIGARRASALQIPAQTTGETAFPELAKRFHLDLADSFAGKMGWHLGDPRMIRRLSCDLCMRTSTKSPHRS